MSTLTTVTAWAASLPPMGILEELGAFVQQQIQAGHLHDTDTNFLAAFQAFIGSQLTFPPAASGPTIAPAGLPGLANPMTTLGDLITGGANGVVQRLGVGSSGQVLSVVSGAPAWAAAGSGSGSGAVPYLCANDAPYNALGDGQVFLANGSGTGGTMSLSSTTVTVAGASFQSSDVGKAFVQDGADTNGSVLETTITAVPTPGTNQCTLARAAQVAVTNRTCYYGTDNVSAYNACATAALALNKKVLIRDPGLYLAGAFSQTANGKTVAWEMAEGTQWLPTHPRWFAFDISGLYGGVNHLGAGPYGTPTQTTITSDVLAGINTTTGGGSPIVTAVNGISGLGLKPGDVVVVGSNHPTWSPDSLTKLDGATVEVLTVDSDHQVTPKEFFYSDVYQSNTAFTVANGATLLKLDPIQNVHLINMNFWNPIIQTSATTVGPANGFVRISSARRVRIDNFTGRGAAAANVVTRYVHEFDVDGVSEAAEYSLNSALTVGGTNYQRYAYGFLCGVGSAHGHVTWRDNRSGSAVDTSGEDTVGTSAIYGYCYDVLFENCISDSSPTNGMAAHPGARGIRFKACTVTNSRGTSFQGRCADLEVDSCFFGASAGSHIALFNRVENQTIRNCTLKDAGDSTNTGQSNPAAGSTANYLLGQGIAISTDTASVIAAASISSMTASGTLVTVTLTGTVASVAPWLLSGYTLDVAGATPAAYNVTGAAVSNISGSTFQYTAGTAPGGSATVLPTITQDFGGGLIPACNNVQIITPIIDGTTHAAIRVGSTTNDLLVEGGLLKNYGKNGSASENYGIAFKGGTVTRFRGKGITYDDSQATITSDRPYAISGATLVDSSIEGCSSNNVLRGPTGAATLLDFNNRWGQASSTRTLITDGKHYAANATGTVTLDGSLGKTMVLTLTGNTTLVFGTGNNNHMTDGSPVRLHLLQDATGGRTVTFPANWVNATGYTANTVASKRDVLQAEYSAADAKWYASPLLAGV